MSDVMFGIIFVGVVFGTGTLLVPIADSCEKAMKSVFRGFLKPEVRGFYDNHD